jgi:rRNA-processing protein CGR1
MILIALPSRSYLPEGVKTKSWDDRMQKTQRTMAIKKLQTELKEEKLAEIKRCDLSLALQQPYSLTAFQETRDHLGTSEDGRGTPKTGRRQD